MAAFGRLPGCGPYRLRIVLAGVAPDSIGGGRCLQVAEWVLTGLRRQVEEVGPQGRPGRLVGEVGKTWPARPVERLNDLGSDELLGRHLEVVRVALDRLEKPDRGF